MEYSTAAAQLGAYLARWQRAHAAIQAIYAGAGDPEDEDYPAERVVAEIAAALQAQGLTVAGYNQVVYAVMNEAGDLVALNENAVGFEQAGVLGYSFKG